MSTSRRGRFTQPDQADPATQAGHRTPTSNGVDADRELAQDCLSDGKRMSVASKNSLRH
jgi:hypothetical protein